jgi:pantothenate kinase type III
MLFLEIGNTTTKMARIREDGEIVVERFDDVEELVGRYGMGDDEIVCAPVGEEASGKVLERLGDTGCAVRVIRREQLAGFVAGSYDTPETLGLDRILNLLGLDGDGIVISCGTAITIDAIAGGVPCWGAIMPGFRTAAEGLHARVPVLPVASLESDPSLPARTSIGSVTNGVLLGTAYGAQRLAEELASTISAGSSPRIILTGGDAGLLLRLWHGEPRPVIDEVVLFRGMKKSV